ncbi:prenylcysteine oxidase 1 [Latimeria chalumnae]|uniref:Prenylcysteine oxidase 1 n=1 Tax=Latimeria chalumnae TaxID=7897 RepID=H3BEM5_LATCH|nr:PREDICTED: prenylcysteine oxidase 1 [Latimeria chalumnae]|eukprot:XP_005988277.1 PREDICTED: prenylcysteine oxidase 1 [Latimeria chalumnae]
MVRISACNLFVLSFWLSKSRGAVAKIDVDSPKKIAIVGAGIGGTSAAYFLRQHFGNGVQIDVFEKGEVGGRLATTTIYGREYETGGSIIHPLNLHMKRFVKDLGLKHRRDVGGQLGIYNGEEFVFEESSWFIINIIKMLWNYGFNFLRMQMWVEDVLDRFMRIYRYQSYEYSFTTVEKLLHAMGGDDFTRMINYTIDEALQKVGFSHKFINEIVTPVMKANYGQSVNINAFVGAVSLAGAESDLWAVEGGNKLVCSGLLYASKAHLISGTITSIELKTRPMKTGGSATLYEVNYSSDSGPSYGLYDIVVIATPMHKDKSNISFLNFSPPIKNFPGYFHTTMATLVYGRLNASFFQYQNPSQFPISTILTMDHSSLFVSSVSSLDPVRIQDDYNPKLPTESTVWKVLSQNPLSKQQLNQLFTSYNSVDETKWLAYPHYSPPERLPPIILHDRIYYVNAIEWAASAIEMSTIAAKNVALLAHHRWYQQQDKINQEGLHQRLRNEL